MESTPLAVTVHLEPQDYARFMDFVSAIKKPINWAGLACWPPALVMIVGASYFADEAPYSRTKLLAILTLVLLACFGLLVVVYFIGRRRLRDPANIQQANPSLFIPNTYTVTEDGLFCQNDNGETVDRWHSVSRFFETETDFFVMLAERRGHILPKRFFSTPETAVIFAAQVRWNLEKYAPAASAAA